MLRRNFIKTGLVSLGSLLGINFLKSNGVDETPLISDFGLGRYVSHTLEEVFYQPGHWIEQEYERGFRFINFPIETKLVINYECGHEDYYTFNMTKQQFAEYANFTEFQLKNRKISVDSCVDSWINKLSNAFEVYKNKDGEPRGFRLQSVIFNANIKRRDLI